MQETLPSERPEYKLGMTDEERHTFVGIDPTDMTYDAFRAEYETAMLHVATSEKNGYLDPAAEYRPMTTEDWQLMAKDWKAFSRSRGYGEEDIIKYERWLELSGQKQEIPYPINDPWRRREEYPGARVTSVYLKLLQQRIDQGERPLSSEVLQSKAQAEVFQKQRQHPWAESSTAQNTAGWPPNPEVSNEDLDVW